MGYLLRESEREMSAQVLVRRERPLSASPKVAGIVQANLERSSSPKWENQIICSGHVNGFVRKSSYPRDSGIERQLHPGGDTELVVNIAQGSFRIVCS